MGAAAETEGDGGRCKIHLMVNPGANGVKDASKAQSELEQVARIVLGRL